MVELTYRMIDRMDNVIDKIEDILNSEVFKEVASFSSITNEDCNGTANKFPSNDGQKEPSFLYTILNFLLTPSTFLPLFGQYIPCLV